MSSTTISNSVSYGTEVGIIVTNGATLVVTGTVGSSDITVFDKCGTIDNFGTITATGSGQGILLAGGVLNNYGVINGDTHAAAVAVEQGSVTNFGTIEGEVLVSGAPSGASGIEFTNAGTILASANGCAIATDVGIALAGMVSGTTAVYYFGTTSQNFLSIFQGATVCGAIIDSAGNGTITLAEPTGPTAGADTLNLMGESGVSAINIAHAATWTLDMPMGTPAPEVLGFGAGDTILLPGFTAMSEVVLPGVGLILGEPGSTVFLNLPQQNNTTGFYAEMTAAGTEIQIATSVTGIGNIPAPMVDTSGTINGGTYAINSTLFGSNGGTAQSGGVGVTIGNGADVVVSGTVYGGAGGNGTDGYWDVIPGQYPAPSVTIWRAGEPGGDGGVGVYLSQSVLVNLGNITGGVPGENGLTVGYPEEAPAGGIGVVIASGTLINAGTISGTDGADAVSFSNAGEIGSGFTYGTGTLVVEPTAVFNGDVVADSSDVLVLVDPTATELSEVGTLFQGFGTVDVVGSAPCFCVGTRIRTPRGTVLVEELRVGDEVVTAFSGAKPIKWIGRRGYEGRFIAGNWLVLPVCIKADAIADGIPSRDLFVSPDHAICEGGVLVHAWRLVNGVSIIQAAEVALVEYVHIELDGHHIVFAEDCPMESFYDADCRERFQSGEGQPGVRPERMCLPLVEGGFHLEALRRRLAERAGLTTPVLALGPLRGCLDEAGPKRLRGWAQDIATPESPVTLAVMADGAQVGLVLANEFRADLREAGLGSGCHAFSTELPSGARDVEIRRAADGAMLARAKLIPAA